MISRLESLTEATSQSKRIKDSVEECANELESVNTVLKDGLQSAQQTDAVNDALHHNEDLEVKVQDCADRLADVNESLIENADQLEAMSAELDAVKAHGQFVLNEALHDALTGLPSRALFEDRLTHEIAQAKRHRLSLTVMFIDLNGFKLINDTHGHAAGDEVLKTIAHRLKSTTRVDDTVSRYGGDEFAYLLGPLNKIDATVIAKKLCATMSEQFDITGTEQLVSVSVSIGIAIYPNDGLTADELMKAADKAMYQAKKARSGFALA